jgi:hypothetical protein
VDVGTPTLQRKNSGISVSSSSANQDPRATEVLALIGEHMPSNSSSPLASYLPGFTSLRLMLMKTNRTPRETELLGTILGSYSSYVSSGKQPSEIAWLLARDCMHLSQRIVSQPPQAVAQQQQAAAVHGQAMSALAFAPTLQGNGSTLLNPGVQSAQGIQGMSMPTAQPYSLPQAQTFQGMQPPPPGSQQQNGQHSTSQGAFGMK